MKVKIREIIVNLIEDNFMFGNQIAVLCASAVSFCATSLRAFYANQDYKRPLKASNWDHFFSSLDHSEHIFIFQLNFCLWVNHNGGNVDYDDDDDDRRRGVFIFNKK